MALELPLLRSKSSVVRILQDNFESGVTRDIKGIDFLILKSEIESGMVINK